MEKNTVILSVEDYNDLRDFKTEILKGSILSTNGYSTTRFCVVTKDDFIDSLTTNNGILGASKKNDQQIISSLKNDISCYKEKFGEIVDDKPDLTQKLINNKIKSLSIWNFIKLKLKN